MCRCTKLPGCHTSHVLHLVDREAPGSFSKALPRSQVISINAGTDTGPHVNAGQSLVAISGLLQAPELLLELRGDLVRVLEHLYADKAPLNGRDATDIMQKA